MKLLKTGAWQLMIKQLFSDLDGTLLNPEGRVSAGNVAAIKASRLPLTLVSARAPIEILGVIRALDLTGPQIAFNGGLIFRYGDGEIQPLQLNPIGHNRAQMLLTFIQTSFPTVSLSCYTQDRWLTEKIDRGVRAESQLTGQAATVIGYADLFKTDGQPVFKIMIMTLDIARMRELATALKQLNYPDISVKLSGQTYLEITSDKAKKSRGIAFIKNEQRLDTEELAAFGDGENDLPMFEAVGTPIVMANATPAVQKMGRWITKSNREDGVAYALTRYLREVPE